MPELSFQVERAEAAPFSATPLLMFKLRIDQTGARVPIHAVALRCQIRIEPGKRRYSSEQQESLRELFGPPGQWGQSVRPMLWTHTSAIVPAFEASTVADLPVPCTYDFNIATTKYFDALGDDGEIPLCLLFSGTVFYESDQMPLQAAPIPWDREANFRLPARVWRQMMNQHYPNSNWLCLSRDVFERLRQFKIDAGHVTWEKALEALLAASEQQVER